MSEQQPGSGASEAKIWSLDGASLNDFRINFRGAGLDVLFHFNARFTQNKVKGLDYSLSLLRNIVHLRFFTRLPTHT